MHKRETRYTASCQQFTSRKYFHFPTPGSVLEESLQPIMEYWTCTICNIHMQLQSRNPHLSGKRHIAAEQRMLQAARTEESVRRWTCTICKIEMRFRDRDSHLTGKRHVAAEGKQQRILQASRAQETGQRWTCKICTIEMQLQSRDSHLSGNRHATAAQSRAYVPNYSRTTNSSSMTADIIPENYGVATTSESTIYATSDMAEVHGDSPVTVWQCTICGCYVPLFLRDSHLTSVDHVKSLIGAIKVACIAVPQTQIQVSNNHFEEKGNMGYQVLWPLYHRLQG